MVSLKTHLIQVAREGAVDLSSIDFDTCLRNQRLYKPEQQFDLFCDNILVKSRLGKKKETLRSEICSLLNELHEKPSITQQHDKVKLSLSNLSYDTLLKIFDLIFFDKDLVIHDADFTVDLIGTFTKKRLPQTFDLEGERFEICEKNIITRCVYYASQHDPSLKFKVYCKVLEQLTRPTLLGNSKFRYLLSPGQESLRKNHDNMLLHGLTRIEFTKLVNGEYVDWSQLIGKISRYMNLIYEIGLKKQLKSQPLNSLVRFLEKKIFHNRVTNVAIKKGFGFILYWHNQKCSKATGIFFKYNNEDELQGFLSSFAPIGCKVLLRESTELGLIKRLIDLPQPRKIFFPYSAAKVTRGVRKTLKNTFKNTHIFKWKQIAPDPSKCVLEEIRGLF